MDAKSRLTIQSVCRNCFHEKRPNGILKQFSMDLGTTYLLFQLKKNTIELPVVATRLLLDEIRGMKNIVALHDEIKCNNSQKHLKLHTFVPTSPLGQRNKTWPLLA